MKRKKTADPLGYGRLLDAWASPAHAGEALGCFATTFTFHASFFETECLGRMLQLESDPESGGAAYLVEREEKMARLMSACVVVDRAHARGQRSLRWDLVPFRTKSGILHAKLSILLWQHHARVIVASANLTESGYRRNLEVFTVLDFHREGKLPAELFGSAADFGSQVLAQCRELNPGVSPGIERSRELLETARRRVAGWLPADTPLPRLRSALVPLTPKGPSVLEQLNQLWPSSSRPDDLYVLSPFFDRDADNRAAQEAWSVLRQRGPASVLYSVVAEPIRNSEKLLVHAPASLAKSTPNERDAAEVCFERIKMEEGRPLHAKSLWLQNSEHYLHCIGSSNFTSAGLGVGGPRNWELNIASWARHDSRTEFRLRNAAWPERERERIDPTAVAWEPSGSLEDEADPKAPLLPAWCGSAIFSNSAKGGGALQLNLGDGVPEEWVIADSTGTRVLLDGPVWRSTGSLKLVELPWGDARPPTELVVRVAGMTGEAWWPVEVRSFSDLPPPQELRDLSLAQLLEILTSALPLHRALQKMRRGKGEDSHEAVPAIALDPLRRFDHGNHLLERTRKFSLALSGLRQRLEGPIPSEEYLEWRLRGPIGVTKVAEAILKEAGSDGEKAFLLGELALELSQVLPKSESGCLPRKRVQEAIRDLVVEFERQAGPLLESAEKSLRAYVKNALRKARE